MYIPRIYRIPVCTLHPLLHKARLDGQSPQSHESRFDVQSCIYGDAAAQQDDYHITHSSEITLGDFDLYGLGQSMHLEVLALL